VNKVGSIVYVGSGRRTPGSGGRGLCTYTSCFSAPKPYRCCPHFLSPGDTWGTEPTLNMYYPKTRHNDKNLLFFNKSKLSLKPTDHIPIWWPVNGGSSLIGCVFIKLVSDWLFVHHACLWLAVTLVCSSLIGCVFIMLVSDWLTRWGRSGRCRSPSGVPPGTRHIVRSEGPKPDRRHPGLWLDERREGRVNSQMERRREA